MFNQQENQKMAHRYLAGLILSLLILAAVFTGGCMPGIFQATADFHQTIAVPDGAELSVANRNGNISITAWDKDYIDVFAVKRSALGPGELEKVQIRVEGSDVITVTTDYLAEHARVSVKYEIRVPSNVTVSRVASSNGSIDLAGLTGDLSVETSNGSIDINRINGSVCARSSNGSITIANATAIRGVRTSNGKIKTELPRIDQDVEIKTSNGSVNLYLAPDLDAELEISTSNGKINLHGVELAASILSDKSVRGKVGVGGYRVNITTSNGSIDLHPLK